MKEIAIRSAELLKQTGTQSNVKFRLIAELENCLKFLETRAAAGEGLDVYDWNQHFPLETLREAMSNVPDKMTPEEAKTFYPGAITTIKETITEVQRGQTNRFHHYEYSSPRPVEALWPQLSELSGHLQMLAEKELTASPFSCAGFTPDDRDFILSYGAKLAPIMFHVGDTSEVPRDDTPRIVNVCYNPNHGEYLEVGIGRPQIIYMLYPTTDGEVFCRGAVLPYYEFRSPTRLDDGEWKNRLDSKSAPARPSWCIAANSEVLGSEEQTPRSSIRWSGWASIGLGSIVVLLSGSLIVFQKRRKRIAK